MISEPQQEQAALYALGLLDADEASAFERVLEGDPECRAFERELRETLALLAVAGEGWTARAASPAVRERLLAEVSAQREGAQVAAGRGRSRPAPTWLPWALAALLLGCASTLLWLDQDQRTKLADYRRRVERTNPAPAAGAALTQVSFCALEPTPDFAASQPRAAVLWDAVHREGKLRVNRLAPPADGKDYQLWTVETGHKQPFSAGVFHVNADGTADVAFHPVDSGGRPVVAVAISLEPTGGSPAAVGPILLLGKF